MIGTADDVQRRALNVWKGILPGLGEQTHHDSRLPRPALSASLGRSTHAALFKRAGLGWVSPFWKVAIKPIAPKWATSFAMYVVFVTLLPWLMGPMEGDDFVDIEARSRRAFDRCRALSMTF